MGKHMMHFRYGDALKGQGDMVNGTSGCTSSTSTSTSTSASTPPLSWYPATTCAHTNTVTTTNYPSLLHQRAECSVISTIKLT